MAVGPKMHTSAPAAARGHGGLVVGEEGRAWQHATWGPAREAKAVGRRVGRPVRSALLDDERTAISIEG